MYAPQARNHIAVLRRARPDVTIEIRRCPAHKGTGNEKADGRAKLAAEEPDARGVEWRGYPDRAEARTMPPPDPRKPQVGDLGEEMGGSPTMGWRSDLQEEIQDAKQAEARWYGCG